MSLAMRTSILTVASLACVADVRAELRYENDRNSEAEFDESHQPLHQRVSPLGMLLLADAPEGGFGISPRGLRFPGRSPLAALPADSQQRRSADVELLGSDQDPYSILGLSPGASRADIKRSFAKLSSSAHPDNNKDDPNAEKKYRDIADAYAILNDPELKDKFDKFGMNGVNEDSGAPDFNSQDIDLDDIFAQFFGGGMGGSRVQVGFGGSDFGGFGGGGFGGRGYQTQSRGPQQGEDLRFDLTINFDEVVQGCSKVIEVTRLATCGECGGSAIAKGSRMRSCRTCGGQGVVMEELNTFFGTIQQQTICRDCEGSCQVIEKYCPRCNKNGLVQEKKLTKVDFPAGMNTGSKLRVAGSGNSGAKGGPAGSLYVHVNVREDPRFVRDKDDIKTDSVVSYLDAALGAKVNIETVWGDDYFEMPAGTQPGTVFGLGGKGIPNVKTGQRGKQYVTVKVEIPKASGKEKELLEQIQKERGNR